MPGVDLGAATTVSWTSGATGATVVLTVTQPDGTTDTPAVTENSGTYSATVATALPGRYLLAWEKAADPKSAYTDILDVWPADPRFLISLADARAAVAWTAGNTANDDTLRLFVAAATVVIEDITGAVLVRELTQTSDGGRDGINLNERPATAADVTVVKVNGTTLSSSEFVVDPVAGIVYAGSSTSPSRFPPGRQNVEITYSTGGAQISASIRLAASELVRHLWQVGHQATRPAWAQDGGQDSQVYTPSGFAVPKRVIELVASSPRLPGIA